MDLPFPVPPARELVKAMHARSSNHFTTIRTEGAILPADLLQRIADGDRGLEGLTPDDFHRAGERLNEVINAAWNRLLGQWQTFQAALAKLPESDPATSATRERWLLPLFRELDYGRLTAATSVEIDGKSYPVSHAWQNTPLHLVGWRIDLDRRTAGVAGAARTSPHSMVQELLNRSDDRLWGFVSNGRRLRILRDNVSLTRQAFVEFDLEAMLDGEVYADFALLWLLCHQSRVEGTASKESAVGEASAGAAPHPSSVIPHPSTCWLEKWSRSAQETGTRALDTLRKGVEDAIVALGRGFVAHPANGALREKLRRGGADGGLSAQDYYRQVLRLVYRLLFLFVSEDRGLLLVPGADEPTRDRFARFYSTVRLRHLAERHRGTRHCDLFQGVALVMQRLGTADGCPELGLPALGSFLWSDKATPDLTGRSESGVGNRQAEPSNSGRGQRDVACRIANSDFLTAIRALAFTVDGNVLRAVDYRNLGAEELGSVYESLLELHPKIHADAGQFELDVAAGHERKTTGSYYTPTSLINCLLDSALEPVVEDRLKEADRLAAGKWKTDAEHREALQIVCRAPWDGSPIRPSDSGPTPEPAPAQLAAETTAAYIAARTPQWDKTPSATRYARLGEHALLNMKICDPACGSGHFLIAGAHRLAKRLAAVRTGDEEPAPGALRHALRDVISHCIYGVDINPMAVELCKINLWLESLEPGKPLSFLDHHIQCGNSLLGATPALLTDGIPDDAFKPIEGDDKTVCSQLKKENKRERQDYASRQGYLFDPPIMRGNIAAEFAKLTAASEDTAQDVASKEERYARLVRSVDYETARLWADTWCSLFVWRKDKSDLGRLCPTERKFRDIERNPHNVLPAVRTEIKRLQEQYQFLHWHLAFPDVFGMRQDDEESVNRNQQTGWNGGFDVVLGNPPWERVKLQEKEWFAERSPEIAIAPSAAARKRLIQSLKTDDPVLYQSFLDDSRKAEGESVLMRNSGRYPLCGRGDVNTYTIFAELNRTLLTATGLVGCIVPSGIATDDTTKFFFQDVVDRKSLVSLFDFENKRLLFADVAPVVKFCLFTSGRGTRQSAERAEFVFFAHAVDDLRDPERLFSLSPQDIGRLNPNTRTCPIFRSRRDAELTKAIYRRAPVLIREADGDRPEENPWGIKFSTMFHMSNDSHLFRTREQLEAAGWQLDGNIFRQHKDEFLPLYEAKLFHQFNHRPSTFEGIPTEDRFKMKAGTISSTTHQLVSPRYAIHPRFWVNRPDVDHACSSFPSAQTFLVFRGMTNVMTNSRNAVFSVIPRAAVGNSAPICVLTESQLAFAFLAAVNSFPFDYSTRQKLAGGNMNFFIVNQLPVLPPDAYTSRCLWSSASQTLGDWLLPRVLELTYTAWDLEPFANECGWPGPPFRWDEDRRFLLRCELDAAFFHLYLPAEGTAEWRRPQAETDQELAGLKASFPTPRDAVDYIMDTFPIVKRKDEETQGEYRTKRVILEMYDAMAESMRSGRPYQTLLDPPPGPSATGLPDWPPNQPRPANWPSHIHPPRHVSPITSAPDSVRQAQTPAT